MTPISYTLHGHPLCLSCLAGDAALIPADADDAHDSGGIAGDVAPIHPGDPADGAPCVGAPCVGCGLPLTASPEAAVVWTCPECGSADLRAFYSERRTCRVGARDDTGDPADAEPWPTYEGDEFVDIDSALFAFACDACNAHDITPCTKGDTHALGHHQAA
jgi:predicted RNA-binding Zn-ribbon protein involved in translation (DUF1610 family)